MCLIYYQDKDILIRNLQQSDTQIITEEEIAQGWHADIEKYQMRLRDQAEGRSVSLVAEYKGNIAGYINDLVLYFSKELPHSEERSLS